MVEFAMIVGIGITAKKGILTLNMNNGNRGDGR